jgi:integrase
MGKTVRDYLVLLLLTGLRREEAASLTWSNVDLKAKTLTVPDTKNREDHTLPLSDYLLTLLKQRSKATESNYVFPGYGPKGHIVFVGKHKDKAINNAGFKFTLHDLRRTFITVAESIDIPAYAVKRLANHKMTNDVTAGYIVTDVERLRKPMQKITDYILKAGKVKKSARVSNLAGIRSQR